MKLQDIKPKVEQLKFLCEAGQCLSANGRFQQATEVFKGVIALAPERSIGYTLLGDAYMNLRNFDEAVKMHKKAVQVDPDNTFARVHLGEILLITKEKDKGLAELRKVQELDPNGSDGALARQLIKGSDQGIFAKI